MTTNAETARPVVVVGVDGSDASRAALRWAAGYAEVIGGEVHAVMAWQWPVTAVTPAYLPGWFDPAALARTRLHTIVDQELSEAPAVTVHQTVQCGHAAQVLLEASRDADMLVVGSSAHGAFSGLLLGSTSERCVHRSSCPVTVLRPGAGPVPADDRALQPGAGNRALTSTS